MSVPVVITVKRYLCPHCRRSRSKKTATVAHIARCWENPASRACLTCANFEPAVEVDYCDSPYCTGCLGCTTPAACTAGVELFDQFDVPREMVIGCPSWLPLSAAPSSTPASR